jgi:hypothetical protein
MPINLPDLRSAVVSTVQAINVTIEPFEPDVPNVISPDEPVTSRFTVANTAPGAVRVVKCAYHVKAEGPVVLQPHPSPAVVTRATLDRDGPTLSPLGYYREMFFFPVNDTLDVGQSMVFDLKGKATELGRATVTVHIHCDVDQNYLFSLQQAGTNGSRDLTVR